VRMASSYHGGILSDVIRPRNSLIIGWIFFSLIYALFALTDDRNVLVSLFLLYGLYYGVTEPAEKSIVTELGDPTLKGTAFGIYNLALALGALPSSLLFGWLWTKFGFQAAFFFGSGTAAIASLLLLRLKVVARVDA
jgi:sugar phosphate permease